MVVLEMFYNEQLETLVGEAWTYGKFPLGTAELHVYVLMCFDIFWKYEWISYMPAGKPEHHDDVCIQTKGHHGMNIKSDDFTSASDIKFSIFFFCKIHCFFNGIKNMVDGQLTSDCNYIVKVWSHQFVWFPWFTLNFRFFEDKYMNICWGYMCELFTMFFIGGVSIILCFKYQSFIVHFTSRIILTHPKKTSLVHLKSPHVWKKHIFLPL